MPEKFQNKYRIQSNGIPNWDYSGNGMYFITLVTQHRECNLGQIINDEMVLSGFGEIVNIEWNKSFEIRTELFCDEYIIMPNHLHAIVMIEKTNENDDDMGETNEQNVELRGQNDETHGPIVETHGRASLRAQRGDANHAFHRKPKSISSFVTGFKSAINTEIDDFIDEYQLNIPKYNKNNHFFQPNYHDHVIRNDEEYHRIKQYIKTNPAIWKDDKFYD